MSLGLGTDKIQGKTISLQFDKTHEQHVHRQSQNAKTKNREMVSTYTSKKKRLNSHFNFFPQTKSQSNMSSSLVNFAESLKENQH